MIVIAIIGILNVLYPTFDAAIAKARYAKMMADLNAIAKAAQQDYLDNDGVWAKNMPPNAGPSFVPKLLGSWPTPPCPASVWDFSSGATVACR